MLEERERERSSTKTKGETLKKDKEREKRRGYKTDYGTKHRGKGKMDEIEGKKKHC